MDEQLLQRLQEYFQKDIAPEDFARYLRRLKLEVVRLVLLADPDTFRKDWLADGLYFLDRITELIDPYLEEQESATGLQF